MKSILFMQIKKEILNKFLTRPKDNRIKYGLEYTSETLLSIRKKVVKDN